MKIKKIKLLNIGPYRNNEIDIDVSKNKNIILIGGKNGAGKTTLLNSIKTGLFGSYAYGFKNGGVQYYNNLLKIFNYEVARQKKSNYGIEIEFSLIENYIENSYKFKRNWVKDGADVIESFICEKNSEELDAENVEIIQTKIREVMPPAVIDTMLFDGEEIARIINENRLPSYLKEIINVNFNINLFEKMEDDIKFYIEKEKEKRTLTTEQINLLEYQNKYAESVKNLKNLKDIEQKYLKLIEELKFKIRHYVRKFENYGGLTDMEKFSMRSSLEVLENSRKENLQIVKKFLEDDIIFYLCKDKIVKIGRELDQEKPKLLLNYLRQIENYVGLDYSKELRLKLSSLIINDDDNIKYEDNEKLIKQIVEIEECINNNPPENLIHILNSSRDDFNNTKIYKKIIGNNENANSKELKQLLLDIKNSEISLEELKEKLKLLQKELKQVEQYSNSALIELDTYEKKVSTEKKEENSFNIARKILKISDDYKNKQIKDYLKKISELSVKKFEEINKKNNYVTKIEIDSDNYSIILFDNKNQEKDIAILSAGEKQLMVAAIIWSIFKLSDRTNMFTFDTPLARLDKENRELFVEKILCSISDQVLILSTDEEIVEELLTIVEKNISKKYLLINDEEKNITEIKPGYFGEVK
ncbi:MAG: DNA sulfur modification protein DndD [Bacilli bacterium]|nr:DNA sulfur modification protein DndD [Bacilli bacterium]